MHAVDERLRRWRSRPESWQKLLLEVFDRSVAVELGGISVELLDKDTMAGLQGAYAAISPDDDERIYLNADWLKSASATEVEAVLLEELGHAIDRRLNGSNDSSGDEGAIFSALIRGVEIADAERSQNDHHILIINGQRIAVEAAAPTLSTAASPELTTITEDTGTPSGQVGTLVSALIDSGGSLNNFSDSDGDLPAIAIINTNLNDGTLYYSTNNGTSWSDIGSVSESSARVLYADSNTRLAFVPTTNFTGTINDLITFKAWDRTGAETISTNPTLTGTRDTTGDAFGITLSADGNTAFVADGSSGLQIIDVSNPASPTITGTRDTTGDGLGITLSADGNTAFVADGSSGLQIIDVSNPASPTITGTRDTTGFAFGVTLSADGNTAFIADGGSGLQIIDVSNPASPTITGTRDTTGFAYGVTLSADGNTAFIADGGSGLQIIDVSNPASPSPITTLDTTGDARGVTLSADGNTAFVADDPSGLQIINVSNPASPTRTATYDTTGALGVTLSADGNTAFVADGSSGLQIINVSNPASPTLTGTRDTTGLAYGVTLSADGNTAFVADFTSGLQIIDVVDPAANGATAIATSPSIKGNFDTSGRTFGFTLSADGNTAFVADFSDGLDIIDISDPTNPTFKGNFDTSGFAKDVTLSADGNTAFVADGSDGLDIIDISDPTNPTFKGNFDTTGDASGVSLSPDGNTAFVTDGTDGLDIIDVSNPTNPTLTASYITPTSARDVSLSADGNTAFVADYTSGLQIIDISTLANPTLIGSFDTSGFAYGVTLSADGNTAFVADGIDGLDIINVSNPASPTITGTYNTSGSARGVTLSPDGNTVFVADSNKGLQVIDITDYSNPKNITNSFSNNIAYAVTLSADGNTAFVADDLSGLTIFDVGGTQSFSSESDTANIEVSNVNDAPTGSVAISGTATQGQTLTAANTLADADGLGTLSYQWKRGEEAITGATSSSYPLVQADVGSAISVTASYTDGGGTAESVSSTATSAVANVNDAPTGSVTISGTPTQGQTLTASNTLADADGLGTIAYGWRRSGTAINIPDPSSTTYTLVQADVGSTISVTASYTDGEGTAESVKSDDTSAVANVNDLPTGSVTISGTPTQGQTLTAANTLADADGLGTIAYGWRRSGTAINIPDPSSTTYTLVQADVGSTITVTASYTDGAGTAESVKSDDTSAVANVNDLPTGSVTISGTPTQGQTLTAANTLADADGLGTIAYGWRRSGTAINIPDPSSTTYTLVQADVGSTISVTASYTDGEGTAESVKSDDTSAVANVNDLPTGSVTISGTPTQGQTLTAANTLADADGLGTISNQWKRAGEAISGATSANYTLVQADVGSAISVTASYTDGEGTAESVKSDDTSAVANVNDLPTGSVTISGTPTQGQTLTAANTLADADGLGTISNQWKRAGTAISGATSANYTLVQADVGSAISVTTSYTDGAGTVESVDSDDTSAVKALFTPTPASDKSSNDSSSSSSSSSSSDKRDSNTAQTIENSLINGRRYWTHNVDSLINQSDINYGLLNDDDYLEVTGGKNNFANGNNGDDHFIVFDSQDSQFLGGKGSDFFEVKGGTDNFFLGSIGEDTFKVSAGKSHISGGDDNDTIEVLGAIEGTFINGNRGNDLITGVAAGVIYRGGKDDDVLAVSQGDAWGDQGFDTFQGVSGDGYALIQDYTVGEDKIDLSMVQGGNWTNSENGLMYTDSSGDQIMLLVGIKNTEQVTLI
ncbi:LVIVD repeat [Synechococcus sp. MIT S9504]|nr:LVIVD repeat [Synechococcus sp. MIT S9504]